MDLYTLPEPLRRQVEDELEPVESIRWLGQPEPRGFPRMAWFPAIFGGVWVAFSLVFLLVATFAPPQAGPGGRQQDRIIFLFVGGLWTLIGLGMMSFPLWLRRSLRGRARETAYAITDRRALVFDGGYAGAESFNLHSLMFFGGVPFFLSRGELRIRSFRPQDLNTIERVQRQDGSGDVIIQGGRVASLFSFPGMNADPPVGIFSIPNVRDVERQLRELRETTDAPIA